MKDKYQITIAGHINDTNSEEMFRNLARRNLERNRDVIPNLRNREDTQTIVNINNNEDLNEERRQILESLANYEYNSITIPTLLNNSDQNVHDIINNILNTNINIDSDTFNIIPNIFIIGVVGLDPESFQSALTTHYLNNISIPESIQNNLETITNNNINRTNNELSIANNNTNEIINNYTRNVTYRNIRYLSLTASVVSAYILFYNTGIINPLMFRNVFSMVPPMLPPSSSVNIPTDIVSQTPISAEIVTASLFSFVSNFVKFIRRSL